MSTGLLNIYTKVIIGDKNGLANATGFNIIVVDGRVLEELVRETLVDDGQTIQQVLDSKIEFQTLVEDILDDARVQFNSRIKNNADILFVGNPGSSSKLFSNVKLSGMRAYEDVLSVAHVKCTLSSSRSNFFSSDALDLFAYYIIGQNVFNEDLPFDLNNEDLTFNIYN